MVFNANRNNFTDCDQVTNLIDLDNEMRSVWERRYVDLKKKRPNNILKFWRGIFVLKTKEI